MDLGKVKKGELLKTLLQLTKVMSDREHRGEVWQAFFTELTAEIDRRNYKNRGNEE